MPSVQDALDRPEFETVDLDVTPEEAQRRVDAAIAGLATAEDADGMKVRTTDGMLVAVIGHRHSGSGDVKSRLAYRTEPASVPATRKAKKLAEALRPAEINS